MRITVVVLFGCGRDVRQLQRALDSLARQSRQPDEIVLVLNGVEALAPIVTHLPLTVVRLPHDLGCPAGRNAGVEAASGDIVVFVDDDGELAGSSISAIERTLDADDRTVGVAGRVVDPVSHTGEADRSTAGELIPTAEPITTIHFSGGAFAVRRDAFRDAGGYFEFSTRQGEELDLALKLLKLGHRILRVDGFVLYHPRRSQKWASTERLLGTSNTVRVFWSRLPLAAAATGSVWKVIGHAAQLLGERQSARIPRLLLASCRAAVAGAAERDALNWRQYWPERALIHPGPARLLGILVLLRASDGVDNRPCGKASA
jgi:GT2 family glycosyltransferase